MEKEKFDTFIKEREEKKQAEKPVDWNQVKTEWLSHIELLYTMVRGWLQEYVDAGRAEIQEQPISLHEEQLGSYQTNRLHVRVADETVTFSPVARLILGGMGRVDMEGSAGKVKFILVDKDTTRITLKVRVTVAGQKEPPFEPEEDRPIVPTWKISTPAPNIQLIGLDEESFFNAFMEAING